MKYGILFLGVTGLFGAQTRTIRMAANDIPVIKCVALQVCEVDFPPEEKVIEPAAEGIALGDSKDWSVVARLGNHIFVKIMSEDNVAKTTDVHILMQSGNVYTFQLEDATKMKGEIPDLRVQVEVVDRQMQEALTHPKYVTTDSLKLAEKEVADVKAQLAAEQTKAATKVVEQTAEAKRKMLREIGQVQYEFERKNPFNLIQISRMEGQTFFFFDHPPEVPSLYEIKDGKPSLVDARYDDGLLVAAAPVNKGYLAVGKKQRTDFSYRGGK